jgi:hypothetical protein
MSSLILPSRDPIFSDLTTRRRIIAYPMDRCGWRRAFCKTLDAETPAPREDWKQAAWRKQTEMGDIVISVLPGGWAAVSMVCMQGHKVCYSTPKPLHLRALKLCLEKVYMLAVESKLPVAFPIVAFGDSGQTWDDILAAIKETSPRGVLNYVYT